MHTKRLAHRRRILATLSFCLLGLGLLAYACNAFRSPLFDLLVRTLGYDRAYRLVHSASQSILLLPNGRFGDALADFFFIVNVLIVFLAALLVVLLSINLIRRALRRCPEESRGSVKR